MMTNQKTKENNKSVSLTFVGIIIAAIVGYIMIFTPVPGEIPVEITEEVVILAVIEEGVVIETSTGVAVVTDQYDGNPGDIIEVTYSVPARYLDDKEKQQVSFDIFHPEQ